ncbi:hypothetical protein Hanom_Chr07g00627311 [Helianthus anomalus]
MSRTAGPRHRPADRGANRRVKTLTTGPSLSIDCRRNKWTDRSELRTTGHHHHRQFSLSPLGLLLSVSLSLASSLSRSL